MNLRARCCVIQGGRLFTVRCELSGFVRSAADIAYRSQWRSPQQICVQRRQTQSDSLSLSEIVEMGLRTQQEPSMETLVPDAKFLRGLFVGFIIAAALSAAGLVYTLLTVPFPLVTE
jgi:hypothetical protein